MARIKTTDRTAGDMDITDAMENIKRNPLGIKDAMYRHRPCGGGVRE